VPIVWSPSGDALAWGDEDGVRIAHPDGAQADLVADAPVAGRPAWAPDGTALAFVDQTRSALVVLDLASRTPRFVAPIQNPATGVAPLALETLGGPAWAPDGSRLAFVCWDGAGDEVCVIDADGEGRRQVTRITPSVPVAAGAGGSSAPAVANVGPPAWSPDGQSLAVAVYPERRGAAAGVFVIDLNAGTARRISSLMPNSELEWTRDGSALIFSAIDDGRSDAMRVRMRDGATQNLTSDLPMPVRHPALSPDEFQLAVASGGHILIISNRRAAKDIAVPGLAADYPDWNPADNTIAFSAAPNPIPGYQ
jgi:Tol biopolymer transport system component